jgi:hypothetical protein
MLNDDKSRAGPCSRNSHNSRHIRVRLMRDDRFWPTLLNISAQADWRHERAGLGQLHNIDPMIELDEEAAAASNDNEISRYAKLNSAVSQPRDGPFGTSFP